MATVVPTSLDVIILAVQARLIASLGWPAERVLVMDPALFDALDLTPQADAFLLLWPDTETPDRPIFVGAGRLDTRATERILVEVRTRTALDEPQSRLVWLTDSVQGLGHIACARHPVLDALIGWLPSDAAGDALTTCPLAPANGQRPTGDRKRPEWGRSTLYFDVQYVLKLTVPPY